MYLNDYDDQQLGGLGKKLKKFVKKVAKAREMKRKRERESFIIRTPQRVWPMG